MTKEENYKQHIKKWQIKGGSIREYCRENQISYDIFQYWQNKYNRGDNGSTETHKKSPFIPIEIKDTRDIEVIGSVLEICVHTDGSVKIKIGQIQ
jgi:DNA polymerase II small subunit/DNA polymerase delta subunit B